MLVGSSAVKDDLLILGQVGESGLELLEGERALKLHAATLAFIGIGAHQQGLAGLDPWVNFLRGDSWRSSHNVSFKDGSGYRLRYDQGG
jgi:hypothetical protein